MVSLAAKLASMTLAAISRVRPLFRHGVCGGQCAARSGSDSQPCGFNLRREGCTQIAILEALGAGAGGGGFTVEHVDVKKIKKEAEKA